MRADAVPLLTIFDRKLRLEVPLFQRQYVWSQGDQWEPLWDDIARKFSEYLEGRKDAPIHFLGAMVLDQKQTPITHVEKRQVIDGQQRLTTLQIFLTSFRDFCREHQCEDLAKECDNLILNKGMMADPKVDKYKVWPTQLDRPQFIDVIDAGSRESLEKKHPLVRKKYHRKPEPRPLMVEAYLFFHAQLSTYFLGSPSDPPLAAESPLPARLEECFQALKTALQVVVIDLGQDDDAQVIFETLNARGEPLLPADLLRNYIFLRAARLGEPQEELYTEHWQGFDDIFWRTEVRQGRLSRPRSDLFMQHFLASRLAVDIPVKHLFVEYKQWIDRRRPFATVADELKTLARQREHFRRLAAPHKDDALFPLADFLLRFDISTVYPLLLVLLEADLPAAEWEQISVILESYLLRRAVCDLATNNYNRIFLALTRLLQREPPSSAVIRRYLSESSSESVVWPSNEAFLAAWLARPVYQVFSRQRIVHILGRLSDSYRTSKMERLTIDSELTIEHLMPQSWLEHWPLPDGSPGLDTAALAQADANDPRAVATARRDLTLQTFGNLTLITQPLNSSISNSAWKDKRPELMKSSLLPLNQPLQTIETWDEDAIDRRARELFERAVKLWPPPV